MLIATQWKIHNGTRVWPASEFQNALRQQDRQHQPGQRASGNLCFDRRQRQCAKPQKRDGEAGGSLSQRRLRQTHPNTHQCTQRQSGDRQPERLVVAPDHELRSVGKRCGRGSPDALVLCVWIGAWIGLLGEIGCRKTGERRPACQ